MADPLSVYVGRHRAVDSFATEFLKQYDEPRSKRPVCGKPVEESTSTGECLKYPDHAGRCSDRRRPWGGREQLSREERKSWRR